MGGGHELPVPPELAEQAVGEGHVAILAALAGLHPDRHALAVEVGDREGDHLADAEADGICGGEQEEQSRHERCPAWPRPGRRRR